MRDEWSSDLMAETGECLVVTDGVSGILSLSTVNKAESQ